MDEPSDRQEFEAVMTTRGQLTIPREIRRFLRLEPGSIVEFVERGDTIEVRLGKRGDKDADDREPA